jgi:hypothetical protein
MHAKHCDIYVKVLLKLKPVIQANDALCVRLQILMNIIR